jgi:Tfp pilus assembly protein PilO
MSHKRGGEYNMAEGEVKPERKQLEMSIWFIILLIVVIVFMVVFMSMNKKLGEANETITKQETLIQDLNKKNSERAELVRDLRKQATDGDLSMKALVAKLDSMGFNVEELTGDSIPAEPVSGEVVTSGEVAE